MLITAKTLNGYPLDNRDGEIGKVKEFYFNDQHWGVRYLVAETGHCWRKSTGCHAGLRDLWQCHAGAGVESDYYQ